MEQIRLAEPEYLLYIFGSLGIRLKRFLVGEKEKTSILEFNYFLKNKI
jgi:hypothetical protein